MTERIQYEIREIAGTTIDFTYKNIGAVISSPVRGIVIYNTTNVPVLVSGDSVFDDIYIPDHSHIEIIPYNKRNDRNDCSYVYKAGTQLKVTLADWFAKGGNVIANIFT